MGLTRVVIRVGTPLEGKLPDSVGSFLRVLHDSSPLDPQSLSRGPYHPDSLRLRRLGEWVDSTEQAEGSSREGVSRIVEPLVSCDTRACRGAPTSQGRLFLTRL